MIPECWSVLTNRLEKGVSVKLLDGSLRTGFVYAVDPQVPCALVLVKVRKTLGNMQTSLSVDPRLISAEY